MQMRRRLSENMGLLIIPVICGAICFYFGYAGIVGPRGLLAWSDAQAELTIAERDLAGIRTERQALQHRITLLDDKALDADLLAEVARGVLSQGGPGEIVVPRGAR